jgi:hypothetical protein
MNRALKIFCIRALLLFFILTAKSGLADGPPPPPPGGPYGGSGNQIPGGGAPLGDDIAFLVLLAVGYGIRRWNVLETVQVGD